MAPSSSNSRRVGRPRRDPLSAKKDRIPFTPAEDTCILGWLASGTNAHSFFNDYQTKACRKIVVVLKEQGISPRGVQRTCERIRSRISIMLNKYYKTISDKNYAGWENLEYSTIKESLERNCPYFDKLHGIVSKKSNPNAKYLFFTSLSERSRAPIYKERDDSENCYDNEDDNGNLEMDGGNLEVSTNIEFEHERSKTLESLTLYYNKEVKAELAEEQSIEQEQACMEEARRRDLRLEFEREQNQLNLQLEHEQKRRNHEEKMQQLAIKGLELELQIKKYAIELEMLKKGA